MSSSLPIGLSPAYWSSWYPPRSGAGLTESLEAGETWIGGWDAVGLYEGNNKIPDYQSISVHLTTHRLILIPDSPVSTSRPLALQVLLSHIRQTEFYTGFMRSSPKITLSLGQTPTSSSSTAPTTQRTEENWTCGVCGFVNPLEPMYSSPGPDSRCGLCGVAYSASRTSPSALTSRTTTPGPTPGATLASKSSSIPSTPVISNTDGRISCPACTFLNHPTLPFCEICSTPLLGTKKRPTPTPVSVPAGASLSGVDRHELVRLSFRKGGEKEAYRRLKNVLSDKVWERNNGRRQETNASTSSTNGMVPSASSRAGAGIDGILQSINLESKAQDEHMQDAFKDLEVLMVRAGEMVKLAQSLNTKLTVQQASSSAPINEDDATLIRTTLVQLGLPTPALTQDMVRDEKKYHEGLADELGSLLTSGGGRGEGLMVGKKGRGLLGLDEVWVLWMRARGVALLPPSTLVAILSYLPLHTSPPIHILILPSTLKVLHTPSYAPAAILSRLLSRLTPTLESTASIIDPKTSTSIGDDTTSISEMVTPMSTVSMEPSLSLVEIAAHEDIPVGLTKEIMESIERLQPPPGVQEVFGLVRDDQAGQESGGVRWYRDIISVWEL